MSRREFPVAVRKAAWARCEGRCEGCGAEFSAANPPEYDHRVEDTLGGEPVLENCEVLGHRCCHKAKTIARAPVLAKVARIKRKAANIRSRKSSLSHPTLRRKLDGTVVQKD